MGGGLRLSLETREVGRVTIVRCNGRIVAGSESESLRAHVTWLLRDRRSIVLHLGEVGFIDSSGIGTIVRSLTSTRQSRGDLKLCNVPEHARKILELSHLIKLFDTHESEEKAVAHFTLRPLTPKRLSLPGAASCASIATPTCSPTCANYCVAPDTTSTPAAAWATL